MECKRHLRRSSKLWRERGNDFQLAKTLRNLSDTNRKMGLDEEGIGQAREASEIFGRLGEVAQQADSLTILASLLCQVGQLDAAEEAGSRAIDLLPEKGKELLVCQAHRALGETHQSRGETEKATHHFEVGLGIASSLNWAIQLFSANISLADVLSMEGKFDDAQTYLDHAKLYAVDDSYFLAYVMDRQARVWYGQHRFREARSEALRALDAFEKLGRTSPAYLCRKGWTTPSINRTTVVSFPQQFYFPRSGGPLPIYRHYVWLIHPSSVNR